MPTLCRDCAELAEGPRTSRCSACRSPRTITHAEIAALAIAHLDADAFYAAIEKRDNPALRDLPVIVGGGRRGVVSTACYIARLKGVHSAMPMFEALRRCPEAVVIRPRMATYAAASREIRALMEALTPAVEPLSLDEAFLDLRGTERWHGAPPAVLLARLARRIEEEVGVTVSVGLSHNKFLAKLASDLDKPRGFAVIGRSETADFLAPRPVRVLWGVGPSTQAALEAAGIRTLADLRRWPPADLAARFGRIGARLHALARGEDDRAVTPHEAPKSIGRETTLAADTTDPDLLDGHIWRLSEQVADRAKARHLAGRTVTLKLKRADHRLHTHRATLTAPTQIADRIYLTARTLFDRARDPGPFRLIGVVLSELGPQTVEEAGDLLDPDAARRAAAERAADAIRARFGAAAIMKGRSLR